MSKNNTVLIIIILIIAIYAYSRQIAYRHITDGVRDWSVASSYNNANDAAQLLGRLHADIIVFMRKMRAKYNVDMGGGLGGSDGLPLTDDRLSQSIIETDRQKIIKALIKNYNADMVFENDPKKSSDTAYTINKGDSLYFCLRNRTNPNTFIPYNTMMFALLHELSHMANYNAWGHTQRFWEVFAFILSEASNAGIYTPEDYSKRPQTYCGLAINYNPLFDTKIASAI